MAVEINMSGQVVIVTGAGRGLGKADALRFAEAGADVVVAEILEDDGATTAEEIRALGRRSLFLHTDISNTDSVNAMVGKTLSEFGHINTLVNNAAIVPSAPWHEITEDEWRRVMDVNVTGYWLCSRSVLPHMQELGKGTIVNIASITFYLGFEGFVHYVTGKGAVVGMTRALAREVGPLGIRVNSVSPGAFPTEAERTVHAHRLDEFDREVIELQSIKRRGNLEDIADAVVFLASDLADFITGQTLEVDGGWVMH